MLFDKTQNSDLLDIVKSAAFPRPDYQQAQVNKLFTCKCLGERGFVLLTVLELFNYGAQQRLNLNWSGQATFYPFYRSG